MSNEEFQCKCSSSFFLAVCGGIITGARAGGSSYKARPETELLSLPRALPSHPAFKCSSNVACACVHHGMKDLPRINPCACVQTFKRKTSKQNKTETKHQDNAESFMPPGIAVPIEQCEPPSPAKTLDGMGNRLKIKNRSLVSP